MITQKELKEKSLQWGVPVETVDKDWVLGHLLNGMYKRSFFRKCLIFKGGTCLKKLYVPDFRFSEDLDFSTIKEVGRDEIKKELDLLRDIIYQNVGVSFGRITEKDIFSNDVLMGYEFRLPFWGAKHSSRRRVPSDRWTTSVKIDVSLKETILMPHVLKKINHPYSDRNEVAAEVTGYCIEEIYSEKLRSLLQRSYTAPRDYYDLWYIAKYFTGEIRWPEIQSLFKKKCQTKKIKFHNVNAFFHKEVMQKIMTHWEASLGSHLKILPEINTVIKELREKLGKLFQ